MYKWLAWFLQYMKIVYNLLNCSKIVFLAFEVLTSFFATIIIIVTGGSRSRAHLDN